MKKLVYYNVFFRVFLMDFLLELERHIHSRDNNLSKIHRQVMNSTDTKADALKNEPIIIRKIRRDYDRIQTLADEKVQIAEEALKLVSIET